MRSSRVIGSIAIALAWALAGHSIGAPALVQVNGDAAAQRSTTIITADLEAEHHPQQLLVRFRPGVTWTRREAVHDAAQAIEVLREYHVVSGLQLVMVAEDLLPDALAVYQNHPDVLYAEPDYFVYSADAPNDPSFDLLWGLHNTGQVVEGDPGTPGADIRALEAWSFWTGDPGFRIAVIDTGVTYTHPDLQANVWTNPGEIPDNGIDDDNNGYVDDVHGYDFYNGDSDPIDDGYHGTHVAGTIGAAANNDLGVVGVDWQCRIVALKILRGG